MNITDVVDNLRAANEYQTYLNRFYDVQGYLQPVEGYALLQLAANGPRTGAIVEIGSYMGLSTCWLSAGSKGAGREKVTAIDHFGGSPEQQEGGSVQCDTVVKEGTTYRRFQEHLRAQGLWEHVEAIVATSQEAVKSWAGRIRLLFIDGDHTWDGIGSDFARWSPFVVQGGIIAFHDVGNAQDVTRFYEELIESGQGYTHLFQAGALGVARKDVSTSSGAEEPCLSALRSSIDTNELLSLR